MAGQESTWIVDRAETSSTGGMVAAKTPQAARAGAEVLRTGGNAVDAAVVSALVSGVAEPWMNGLGGGGYLVRHDSRSGETSVVAFPMVSAASARPDMFELTGTGVDAALFGWPSIVDSANIVGHRAVSVPGEVAGLSLALETWGTRSWASVFDPAIALAEEGLPVTWHTTLEIARDLANLRTFPATGGLLCPNGIVPWSTTAEAPVVLRQPDLATTMRTLADEGPRSFYEGQLATTIVDHLNEGGAKFSKEDFASYQAQIEAPVIVGYNGHSIATNGNGSGGATLAESVRLLDRAGVSAIEHNSAEALHAMAQAFAIAFADRFAYLADPEFVDVPFETLLSDGYIESRLTDIRPDRVAPVKSGSRSELGVRHHLEGSFPDYTSGGSTTHLSVIDKDGVAVSLTQTLLSLWGSRVTIPGTGIIMNNGMMWFDPVPGRPNSIAGRKKGLSNMSPAILIKEGTAVAALGASGGRKIMNCVAQIAMNLADRGMSMQPAVSTPRIDRSTPRLLLSARLPESTVSGLRDLGHDPAIRDESLFFGEFASPACVAVADGTFTGGVDPYYYPATASGA